MLLRLPEPYDFALSTERFRAFGVDLANLWHEGGLHRVVGTREVRIEAAPGGVDVEPLDAETAPVVEKLLGLEFDLDPFVAWAAGQPVLDELVPKLEGFRPPLAPDPFESLVTSITAQQVSLFSAFAIRSRFIERYGVRGQFASGFPTRASLVDATEEDLFALGFSRRKAEYVLGLARADIDLDALAALPDDEIRARLTAHSRTRPVDGRMVPRTPPRAADARGPQVTLVCGRRPKSSTVSTCTNSAPASTPFQNLSAHYLLTGLRVAPPA